MPDPSEVGQWQAPYWLDRLAGISSRAIVITTAVVLLVVGLLLSSPVLFPAFMALLFAAALAPVCAWLTRRRLRPGVGSLLSLVLLTSVIAAVGYLTVRAVVDQWEVVLARIDDAVAELEDGLTDTGIDREDASAIVADVEDAVQSAGDLLTRGLLRTVPAALQAVSTFGLSLLIAFFYLRDGPRMWQRVVDGSGGQPLVDRIGRHVWLVLTGFIRGTTVIAAIDALGIGVWAALLGVPHAGTIAMLTFLAAYIPIFGAFVAGCVGVLLAISEGGLALGLWMLAGVLAVQAVEGNLLQPVVQGRSVNIHPLTVALSVVAGGALAGPIGMLVAVPIVASVLAVITELRLAGMLPPIAGIDLDHPDRVTASVGTLPKLGS